MSERLNASQRRIYSLVEYADQEAQLWPISEDLEQRARLLFPVGWITEIRISQEGHLGFPRCFKLRAYCAFDLSTYPFQILALNPATSRPELGCWVTRAFRVVRP